MGKNIGKNISKNLSSKYSQKFPVHEATGDIIDNDIADQISKVSKALKRNYYEAVKNRHDKEKPKES